MQSGGGRALASKPLSEAESSWLCTRRLLTSSCSRRSVSALRCRADRAAVLHTSHVGQSSGVANSFGKPQIVTFKARAQPRC